MRKRCTKPECILPLAVWFLFVSGCAHYPLNSPAPRLHPDNGYRFTTLSKQGRSDSLLLLLAFSGGGSRAAALSYGVLEELAKTQISWEGKKRRLLDEVDWISAVSGGSFTAAYYAVHGEDIFKDFESRFLDRNIQGRLVRLLFSPVNWVRLASPHFDRSDLAADYYDRHLFEHRTFGDLLRDRQGPFLMINATDMELGFRFEFTQEQFDLLCSDLSSFSVARAVAASSSYPGLLTPITLKNYGGTCGSTEPEWMKVCDGAGMSTRRQSNVMEVRSYSNQKERLYIHLLDGGLADNLGVRGFLEAVIRRDSVWQTMKDYHLQRLRKVILIVVNASAGRDYQVGARENAPGTVRTLRSAIRVPINRYSFETVEIFRDHMEKWREEIGELKRAEVLREGNDDGSGAPTVTVPDVDFHIIEINFNALLDDTERRYFSSVPTRLSLPRGAADRLREVAGRLLQQSPEWAKLLEELHAPEADRSANASARSAHPQ